jgi:hypothetical protein
MKVITHSSNILTIENFWSKNECEQYIKLSESLGYEAATVQTENGHKVVEHIRNNYRVLFENVQLAEDLWSKLIPFAPSEIGNSKAVGLNELFRFYKYGIGEEFKKHRDQSFIRNEVEASYFTFMIYLNETFEGGETEFKNITINLYYE